MPNPATYGTNLGGKGFRASSALQDPAPRRESVARQNAAPPPTGTHKVLVVMMSFTDTPFDVTQTAVYYRDLIFGAGNSLAAYYNRNSYGELTITGVVYQVASDKTMGWYGADAVAGSGSDDANGDVSEMTREATQKLKQLGFDYSPYDTNNDNIIDHLMIIHAGQGQEEGPDPGNTQIWSHRGEMATPEPINLSGPLAVRGYTTVPATAKLGVIAHEFGHDLGLPDLYDTDKATNGESFGAGKWDLMAAGSWLGDGTTPSDLSAWSKKQLGWITPNNVTTDGNYTINAVENVANAVYRLWKNGDAASQEYFLIENRQDANLVTGGLGKGLLVWRINDIVGDFASNNVNNDPDNLRVALVEAHTTTETDGLADLYFMTNQGDASDPFPGSGNKTSFTALSIPDSYRYYYDPAKGSLTKGAWSFVEITNISPSGPSMTAKLGVQAAAPALPGATGPSGLIAGATPGFSWNYVDKVEKYRLQIATTSNFQAGTIVVDQADLQQLSYTPSALVDNTYYWRLAAVNEQNSANPTYTAPVAFTVDTAAPAAPVFNAVASPNKNNPLTVSGTAEAESTVRIYVDGSGTPATTVTAAGGVFSASLTLADGPHTISATATDAANHVSAVSTALAVTVDTVAPAAPTVTVAPSSNNWNFTVSGTAEANSTVKVFANSGPALATVTATGGAYSTQVSVTGDGTYSITVTGTDAAGNISPTSAPATVVVDAPPAIAARNPGINATGFPVTSNIEFTFTESVVADTVYSAAYTGNVQLKKGTEIVPATITYDAANKKVIIDPVSNLTEGTAYDVSVSGVKDTTGNTIAATSWTFTTYRSSGGGGAITITAPSGEVTIKVGETTTISSSYLQITIPVGATDEKLTGKLTQLESTDSVYTGISKIATGFAGKVVNAFDFSLSAEDGNYSLKQGLAVTFKVENTDKDYGFYRLDPVFNTLVPIQTLDRKDTIEATIKQPGKLVVLEEKTVSFADLPADSWAKPYIYGLARKNVLNGMNNTKFGPKQELTRGQLAKIITLATGIPGTYNSAGFKDVNAQNTWAINYINSAKTAGVISGYKDGSFKPDKAVTRAELIKMAVTATGLTVESQQGAFKDTRGHWAEKYIATAVKAGIVSGYSDKSFKPDAPVTREEAAKIIAVASGYVKPAI